MGLTDAVFLLESLGIEVVVRGRGTVRSQSLSPGDFFRKGQKIILEMSLGV